jgi:hypothetical protein
MIKAKGIMSVEPHKGRMVLNVSDDLIKLYYWFISKRYWIRMNTPLHGAHITLYSQKFNKKVNWEKAVYYDKKVVEFEYDPNIVEGGYNKGFLMYYLRVYSYELVRIKKKVGIQDGPYFRGEHLTICNGKFNSVFPTWPSMIEIKK